jgi:zinc transporter 2
MSYGYHRSEVIGALGSVILIWGLTIWLVYEAISRIVNPQEVGGLIMLITSGVGLICNLVMMKVLHGDHGHGGHDHGHDHGHSHGHSHGHDHGDAEKKGINSKDDQYFFSSEGRH